MSPATLCPIPAVLPTYRSPRLVFSIPATARVLAGSFSSHLARTFQVSGGAIPAQCDGRDRQPDGHPARPAQGSCSSALWRWPTPTSSTLNFPLGDDRANGVTVALGAGGNPVGHLCRGTLGPTAQVIFDVTRLLCARYQRCYLHTAHPDSSSRYPQRHGSGRCLQLAPGSDVPGQRWRLPANATAVTGNLTVTGQTSGRLPLRRPWWR